MLRSLCEDELLTSTPASTASGSGLKVPLNKMAECTHNDEKESRRFSSELCVVVHGFSSVIVEFQYFHL